MKPEMFDVAARCFESGQSLDPVLRRFRERQAARYFFKACGIERGGPDVERTRSWEESRVRSPTAGPGESSQR